MILPELRSQKFKFDAREWFPRPPSKVDKLLGQEERPRPNKLKLIFINGRGSSGKDTQAQFLIDSLYHNAPVFSVGKMIRDAQEDPSSEYYARYYDKLKPYFEMSNAGEFIPDEVVLEVVQAEIEYILDNTLQENQIHNGEAVFIFTGFPRTLGQNEAINSVLSEGLREHFPVDHVHILYDVTEEESKGRAEARRNDPAQPIRRDDEEAVVERRLAEFKAPGQTLDTLIKRVNDGTHLLVVRAKDSKEAVHDKTLQGVERRERPINRLAEYVAEKSKSEALRRIGVKRTIRNMVEPFRVLSGKRMLHYPTIKKR